MPEEPEPNVTPPAPPPPDRPGPRDIAIAELEHADECLTAAKPFADGITAEAHRAVKRALEALRG